ARPPPRRRRAPRRQLPLAAPPPRPPSRAPRPAHAPLPRRRQRPLRPRATRDHSKLSRPVSELVEHYTVATLLHRHESLEAGADPAGTMRRTVVETRRNALHPDIIDLFAERLTDPGGSEFPIATAEMLGQ